MLFAFFVSEVIAAGSTVGLVIFGTMFAILIVGTAWVWLPSPDDDQSDKEKP